MEVRVNSVHTFSFAHGWTHFCTLLHNFAHGWTRFCTILQMKGHTFAHGETHFNSGPTVLYNFTNIFTCQIYVQGVLVSILKGWNKKLAS